MFFELLHCLEHFSPPLDDLVELLVHVLVLGGLLNLIEHVELVAELHLLHVLFVRRDPVYELHEFFVYLLVFDDESGTRIHSLFEKFIHHVSILLRVIGFGGAELVV